MKGVSSLIPSGTIRLLPNCGHVMTNSLEYIHPFLMESYLK